MYRHHPQTILVKQMVDNGDIGKLHLIRGSFHYTNKRSPDVRFDPNLGGGSLWDVGCYPISYSRYLTGKEPIIVYGQQVMGSTGVDVLFTGQLLFPGDTISQFDCSFITPYKVFMEITGDKGRITIPEPYKPGVKTKIFIEREGKTRIRWIKGEELYRGEVRDIENAILFDKPTRINLEESRANIITIEALYKSARLFTSVNL
jgi:predicted dehydrogenase